MDIDLRMLLTLGGMLVSVVSAAAIARQQIKQLTEQIKDIETRLRQLDSRLDKNDNNTDTPQEWIHYSGHNNNDGLGGIGFLSNNDTVTRHRAA